MKDKVAGAGLALMMLGISLMDSESLVIPTVVMIVSFAMLGIAAYFEWKEEHNERIICRSVAGHKEKEILR